MSRRSRTRFALLGSLTFGEKSGYDLKKDFEHRMSHFWAESLGQIYPTLHRLRNEGLVTARTDDTSGRPERRLYRLTEAGRAVLHEWLLEEPSKELLRNELLLKLYFGPEMGVKAALRHLEALERRLLQQRQIFRLMTEEIDQLEVSELQRTFWLLTLGAGQETGSARLKWCRGALRTLRELDESGRHPRAAGMEGEL